MNYSLRALKRESANTVTLGRVLRAALWCVTRTLNCRRKCSGLQFLHLYDAPQRPCAVGKEYARRPGTAAPPPLWCWWGGPRGPPSHRRCIFQVTL